MDSQDATANTGEEGAVAGQRDDGVGVDARELGRRRVGRRGDGERQQEDEPLHLGSTYRP